MNHYLLEQVVCQDDSHSVIAHIEIYDEEPANVNLQFYLTFNLPENFYSYYSIFSKKNIFRKMFDYFKRFCKNMIYRIKTAIKIFLTGNIELNSEIMFRNTDHAIDFLNIILDGILYVRQKKNKKEEKKVYDATTVNKLLKQIADLQEKTFRLEEEKKLNNNF